MKVDNIDSFISIQNSELILLVFPGVPSYPPPTFQEAMGIIPSPSSSTLAQSSSSASANLETDPPPTTEHYQSESETSISHASPTDTPSTSESEESLEIISPQPGDQRIKFPPCLVSSPRSLSSTDSSISPTFDSLLTRGRAKSKMASILDLNDPDEDIDHSHELEPGLVRTSTKKRFLSLSPLRTLFPPKQHQALQNRALSAHPPGTSPYSTSRSVHFFRSTTSLASASVLRFPSFGASSLTLSGNNNRQPDDDVKPMSGKSGRKFLPSTDRGKGMQRLNEDEVSDNESFESWEVLGHDGEIESRRIENEPRNLMAMIVSTSDSLPPEVISSEVSPTRSLSFTYGAPPAPTILSSNPTPVTTDLPKSSTQTTSSQTEPHPLSLRDKKVQEAIQPLLNRQPKRVRGSNRKSKINIAPSTISVSPLSLSGDGPPVTRVRTKMNQVVNSNQDEQQQTTPIVVNNSVDMVASKSEEHQEDQDTSAAEKGPMVVKNTQEFQKALDTPLPLSPINSSSPFTLSNASILPPISLASTSPPVITSISSSKTSVAIRDDVILCGDGRGEVGRQPKMPAPGVEMLDTHMQEPETVDCVWKHHSTLRKALVTSSSAINSSPQRSPSPATSPPIKIKQHFDATPVMSSTSRASHRRHYQGRPLPRIPSQIAQSTPSRNAVVDSIYAGHETYPSCRRPNTPMVPEGLLIDLEHDGQDMSGAWTPPRSYQMNISSAPMTPQPDCPVGLLMSSPDHSARFLFPSSSTNVSSFGSLSEMTDLEIIAATLGERNHNSDRDADNEVGILS